MDFWTAETNVALETWAKVLQTFDKWFDVFETNPVFKMELHDAGGTLLYDDLPDCLKNKDLPESIILEPTHYEHSNTNFWTFDQQVTIFTKFDVLGFAAGEVVTISFCIPKHTTNRSAFIAVTRMTQTEQELKKLLPSFTMVGLNEHYCNIFWNDENKPYIWEYLQSSDETKFARFQRYLKQIWNEVPQKTDLNQQEQDRYANLWRLTKPAPNEYYRYPTMFWPVGGDNLAVEQFVGLLAMVYNKHPPLWATRWIGPYEEWKQITNAAIETWTGILQTESKFKFETEAFIAEGSLSYNDLPILFRDKWTITDYEQNPSYWPFWHAMQFSRPDNEDVVVSFGVPAFETNLSAFLVISQINTPEIQFHADKWGWDNPVYWRFLHSDDIMRFEKIQMYLKADEENIPLFQSEQYENLWRLTRPVDQLPSLFWPVGGDNLAVKQFMGLLIDWLTFPETTEKIHAGSIRPVHVPHATFDEGRDSAVNAPPRDPRHRRSRLFFADCMDMLELRVRQLEQQMLVNI